MKAKTIIFIILLAVIVGGAVFLFFYMQDEEEFNIDSVLIKSVLKPNSTYEAQLKIENLKDYARTFRISFDKLDKIARAIPSEFELNANEKTYVNISFSNLGNFSEGVYTGLIYVVSDESVRTLPIIIEIESEDVLFDSNIEVYPKDMNIEDGVNANIKVFDLSKIGASNIEVAYFINDFSGNVVWRENENIMVEGGKIEYTKQAPAMAKEGDYIFGITLKYKNSIGTASSFFRVNKKAGFIQQFISGGVTSFLIIIVFVIFLVILFIFYSVYSRDRFLKDLRNQYKIELARQGELLRRKERILEMRLRTRKERIVSKTLFREVRKKRKKEVKNIYKSRVLQLKKIRKTKKKNEIQSQVEKWKKQGYDTSVLEKIKIPTMNDIKRKIGEWKKQGYDTSVLEKMQSNNFIK